MWFFMPFVIGWFIAFIANPLVCWLEKRLKIVKKLGSGDVLIAVLAGVVSVLYFGISKLADEVGSLITNFPQIYSELETGLREIGESFRGVFSPFAGRDTDGLECSGGETTIRWESYDWNE